MNISISGIAHEMRVVANMIENNCEPTIGAKTAKQTREVERSLRAAELRKFADRIEKAIHLEYAIQSLSAIRGWGDILLLEITTDIHKAERDLAEHRYGSGGHPERYRLSVREVTEWSALENKP